MNTNKTDFDKAVEKAVEKAVRALNWFKSSNNKITIWGEIRRDIEKEYPNLKSLEVMSVATDIVEGE